MIAEVSEGSKEDVDLAVKAARDAFDNGPWPRFSGAVSTSSFFLIFHGPSIVSSDQFSQNLKILEGGLTMIILLERSFMD